jgi:hypothetical protein
MTKVRVSVRSVLDTGEAGHGRSNVPMDVAMERATAVTSIATETVGATIYEPMERYENGNRRRRSKVPAPTSDWRCRIERTIQKQAQEQTQLHWTVRHLAKLVEAWAVREDAQWLARMTWTQKREHKWDAHYVGNKLWVAGIANMIVKIRKGVARGQEGREKQREGTVRTDGGGLVASQYADTTREEGQEQCQQPQQQPKPKPKVQLKLQPKLQPVPKLKEAPTHTH